jgi:NAD(P)-dependent dehydrogenase (short-subunit alcohol dehydrogenase family)
MRIDKVVLITGATGALGTQVVAAVAPPAARLALTARHLEPLQALAERLSLAGERTLLHPADLAREDDVTALMAAGAARWGGVDVLFNLAGGWSGGARVAEVTLEDWQAALETNLHSALLVDRAVLPYMAARKWGRIINIASRAAEDPGPRQVAYNVAKAGVVALTRSIAAEYRRSGVAAITILPGIIDTPANRDQMPDADFSRWVAPQQIAELLLFLASEAGGNLNGAAIPIYGRA